MRKQRKQTLDQDNSLSRELNRNLELKYEGMKGKISQLRVECGLYQTNGFIQTDRKGKFATN